MGRFEGECSGKTLASVILLSIGSTLELLDENEGTLHVTCHRRIYVYDGHMSHMATSASVSQASVSIYVTPGMGGSGNCPLASHKLLSDDQ